MAVCEKCGKEYLTKECVRCRNKEYTYNRQELDGMSFKENKSFWKVLSAILFISLLMITIGGLAKIIDLTEQNKKIIKDINVLQDENSHLRRKNDMNVRLIDSYKRNNIELQHKLNRNSNRARSNYSNSSKTQKKTYQTKQTRQTRSKNTYDNSRQQYKQPTKRKSQGKTYQNFSSEIKLVSDSKITKEYNNKLKSNAPIYGRYYAKAYSSLNPYPNQIAKIQCGLKNDRYGIVDECSMRISQNHDKVYLGKMDSRNISEFNYKTHMIECLYSKNHGIMGSCKVKMR